MICYFSKSTILGVYLLYPEEVYANYSDYFNEIMFFAVGD